MSPDFIYTMKDLRKVVPPKREILKGIWLSFFYGAKIGVLGLNGAGKSSLLRIMAGVDPDFIGEAFLGKGYTVGLLDQEPRLDPKKNVLENVQEGVAAKLAVVRRWNEISAKFAEPMGEDEMNRLLEEQAKVQDRMDAENLWELDRQLEIGMDALRCPPPEADVTRISGGERRRVALCRLLLQRPDLLLLDEPTNHLDAESVAWLQRFLRDYPGTVVTVTHARYSLDEVAGWTLELDRGHGIPFEGNYSGWLEQKQARLAGEGKAEEARRRTLERELEWVRQSPRARQAKSKARVSAYEALVAESREKAPETAQIVLPPGPRLGDLVVDADKLRKGVGNPLVIEEVGFRRPSGGERNRVHLAKMLKQGANLLLLDEPTNDLDVDTLRALEEALLEYPGCAVIITHDRWFLDRIATHILAFEGDSQAVWFEGNYADYEADRRRRLGAEADKPHRIRYKPLMRN